MLDVDLKAFGARIRQARERLGLSQEELAHRIDKDQTAVSEYENGKRKVSITELPLMAQVLQVSIPYFFGDDLTPDDWDRLLLHEFHRLPESARPTIIEMLRLFTPLFPKKS